RVITPQYPRTLAYRREISNRMREALAAAALLCVTLAIPGHSQNLPLEPRYVLSVDVSLVNVSATVIDGSGKYIENLTAEDFRVLEDGREQTISFFSHDSRLPVSIGVLLDSSGSVQDKLRQGLQTVAGIASTISAGDEMFVMTFNSRIDLRQGF